ncbi:Pyruvate/Phosphoenolpyruvate kinase-like domain-containing protein [Coemansia mojavensis]|nr:Pyruvate/Phosphoenolpyruvate kinase-like domain-containing protein [Coemansia mojavensis]
MHGGSGSHFDGPSGGSDHPGHYPHGSSAMPMPPPGHQVRQPMGQEMNMRMRSPGSGFAPRHGGHPMAPPMQQQTQHPPPPISTSHQQPILPPPQQQPGMGPPPIAHHSSRQTPISPSQQPHTPRYYPPGPGGQLPPNNQLPQPHNMGQRQGGPAPAHGMSSQRPSPTKSPQMSVSSRPLARLKSKLQRQIPVFGVWLTIPSPVTARILAAQGFDWACIDMEHTPTNPSLMAEMVAAVAGSGTCAPIVRVPSHAPEWFKWALDAGAHGIIVPMVNTVEELRNVERLCRYPPAGKRSMGAFFAPNAFGLRGPRAMNDYVDNISDDILIIPQIESVEGVRNLPSMLKGGGIDAVFVGPYDLNASVRSTQDMQIQEVMAHLERVTKENDIPIGIYASSGAAASSRLRDGYTFLVAASDIECLSSSASDNLDRAKSALRQYR